MSTITTSLKFIAPDWGRLLAILLALAGIGVSAYLMWGYTTPGVSLACGASQGCDTVKNSVYANLMGVPLPVMGLVTYLLLLILLVAQNQVTVVEREWTPYFSLAIFGVSLGGMLYSAYLTYLELFVINAVCRWCVASAVIITAIFLFSFFNLRNNNSN